MNLSQLKSQTETLITENQLQDALLLLKQYLDTKGGRLKSGIIQLSRQYNDLMDEKIAQTISRSEYTLEMNKLSQSIMMFLNKIEEVHLKKSMTSSHQKIANPLLLIAHDDKSGKDLQELLLDLNFTNVTVVGLTFTKENINLKDYHLIIFDNTDLPSPPRGGRLTEEEQSFINMRTDVMNYVINNSPKFIVHYGNFLHWIDAHRNRAQAANSQFTLYARIKEVLEFMNTYHVYF